MDRRLYFLAPDEVAAQDVVDELEATGIPRARIHALGRENVLPETLPPATDRQRRDALHMVERLFWNGNLALFAIALMGLLLALRWERPVFAVLCAAVMTGTFILGLLGTRLPDVRLREFADALRHGEILVFADVQKERVAEIEERVHRRYPEVAVGGVSWSIGVLGL